MTAHHTRPVLAVTLLISAALVLLLFLVRNPFAGNAPYSAPVWWVALKAPQYPATAFPDGIRIHFHVDGVFNGCKKIHNKELTEDEALNCKHEMDAINHYVGMYPIAAGAPVERAFAPFIFSLLGLMLVTFVVPGRRLRTGVLLAGCIIIASWMSVAMYSKGGVKLLSPSFVSDITETMDLYPEELDEWSAATAIKESYSEALGRYFRETDVIEKRTEVIAKVTTAVYGGILGAMVLLVAGVYFSRKFYWLLVIVPMLLPVFFVLDYAGWLWWFGHNMNEMGAFTVKAFMPTVFGQGKVAQFSTHSYPYWGYLMMLIFSGLIGASALLRRKQLKEIEGV